MLPRLGSSGARAGQQRESLIFQVGDFLLAERSGQGGGGIGFIDDQAEGALGAGAGEEVAVVELAEAVGDRVAGVDVGECDFGVCGDGCEGAEGEVRAGEGGGCVGGAGMVEEGGEGGEVES